MALEQKLQLKLAQKLVMTPSLQQAIKLLQMTRVELQNVVSQELEENPVLEEGEHEFDASADAEETDDGDPKEAGEADSMEEIDIEAYFDDVWDSGGENRGLGREIGQAVPVENTLVREPDLYDHLHWQLQMSEVTGRLREIAELIIGNLDEDGFLAADLDEIRAMGDGIIGEKPYTEDEVVEALELVRGFDPPGIACFDLRECLLRQLEAAGEPDSSLLYRVVDQHWQPLMKRQVAAIAKELAVDLEELKPVVEAVRALETRPGRKFNAERTQYVQPDVHVVKVADDYVIQLNDDGLPRLRVSRAYRRMLRELKAQGGQADTKNFIKDKLRSAVWLIKSLDQRQRTIYKVAESIVKQQRGFLDRGIDNLRPMVLRDVADDIGMHESTVSRVVSNKYIHTPRGLFPMKFFFHSGIERSYGGDISSLTVKRKLEHLIASEDRRHPLSDSELTRILQRDGINIARRTVAKYRDELGVASSTQRKEIF